MAAANKPSSAAFPALDQCSPAAWRTEPQGAMPCCGETRRTTEAGAAALDQRQPHGGDSVQGLSRKHPRKHPPSSHLTSLVRNYIFIRNYKQPKYKFIFHPFHLMLHNIHFPMSLQHDL